MRHAAVLPAVAGLLLAASFPPFHLVVPPFVALVPFILRLRSLPADAGGGREAFRAGGALGLVYFGLLLAWLLPALTWLTPLGPLLYIVVVLLLAAIPGAVGWCVHRLVRLGGAPAFLAVPVAWTAGEWLRGSLPGGLAFPWLGLGTSLTAHPEIVGIAELVGARGVTFWLVLINTLVAELVARLLPGGGFGVRRRRRPDGTTDSGGRRRGGRAPGAPVLAGALAVAVVLPAGWGLWRAETLPTRSSAPLALIRTDIAAGDKEVPERALEATRAQLRDLGLGDGTGSLGRAAMMIWPETTFPFPVPGDPGEDRPGGADDADRVRGRRALDLARAIATEEGTPVLFGALDRRPAVARERPSEFNAAFLVDAPGGGGEAGSSPVSVVYRKRYLVPLVETSPTLLAGGPWSLEGSSGWWDAPEGGSGGLAPGGPANPVPLPGWARGPGGEDGALPVPAPGSSADSGPSFGVLICFESAFPAASRGYRTRGADLLVNMTNDVWFGDGSGFLSRIGARQHEAHMVMRAVENRMGVARSANGGGTFFVDPVGWVHGRSDDGPAVTVARARTSDVRTLYSRTGDWAGPGSALLLLLAVIAVGRRARRAHPNRNPGG